MCRTGICSDRGWHATRGADRLDPNLVKEVISMSKDVIMEALGNDELRKQLLEDLEIEELEERVAARPWICFRPAIP